MILPISTRPHLVAYVYLVIPIAISARLACRFGTSWTVSVTFKKRYKNLPDSTRTHLVWDIRLLGHSDHRKYKLISVGFFLSPPSKKNAVAGSGTDKINTIGTVCFILGDKKAPPVLHRFLNSYSDPVSTQALLICQPAHYTANHAHPIRCILESITNRLPVDWCISQ